MNTFWAALRGYKTYGGVAVGLLCIYLKVGLGWDIPGVEVDQSNWANAALELLLAATIRHGIASA